MKIFFYFALCLMSFSTYFCFAATISSNNNTNKNHPCFAPQNKLCQNIVKLKPSIDLNLARKLSNDFFYVSKKYKLPPEMLISIAMQESGFRVHLVRQVRGLYFDDKKEEYSPMTVASDFCAMQINVANIKHFKWDAHRLTTDSRYCIEAGAKILSDNRNRHSKKDDTWWTRYNAASAHHRETYHKMVLRHWRKLDPEIDNQHMQESISTQVKESDSQSKLKSPSHLTMN